MKRLNAFALIVLATTLVTAWPTGLAQGQSNDQWPQWGGPNRDHKSLATGLMQTWPASGPKLVWSFDQAGRGFSAPAVANGRLFLLGADDENNFVLCLDASTGKTIWRTKLSPIVSPDAYNHGWGGGPRSTPTVVRENMVLVLDDAGNLANLDAGSGKIQWKVNLVKNFGGSIPKWGYSESPLVDGDRVIVCPGGPKFLVALDLVTGTQRLASTGYNKPAHYVSVMKHSVQGVDSYVTASESGLVAFSAADGRVLWTNAVTGNGTATIPTPIIQNQFVYHTSNYGAGCVLVEVERDGDGLKANERYANKVMVNHHGGVVMVDGLLFGHKRQGGFVCQDWKSGEMLWNNRLSGDDSSSVAFADGRLYVYGDGTGTCYLVEPNASKWSEVGKLKLPAQSKLDRLKGKIWTHPVIAEGKLFLRDLDLIYAFDVKQ